MASSGGDSGRDSGGAAGTAGGESLKAYQSTWAWVRFIVPAVVGLGADQWLKYWAFPDGVPTDPLEMPFAGRQPGNVTPMFDHVLGFTTTVNQGAVFGIGQGHVGVFLAFGLVALAVIIWVFAGSGARHRAVHVALGMITAGAIGNLYDRAMFHGVRDMLKFLCFHYPPVHLFGRVFPNSVVAADGTVDWYPYIFNGADLLLCVGVPLLMVRWIFWSDAPKKRARDATGPANGA